MRDIALLTFTLEAIRDDSGIKAYLKRFGRCGG